MLSLSFGESREHDVVVLNLQNSAVQGHELPFKCRMLCVSLVFGTLAVAFIFLLFHVGFISVEVALWTAMGVFVAAAIYESVLLSLIVRHLLNQTRD